MPCHDHYLVGYGSLISRYSREYYSSIYCDNLPVTLHGWQREWTARGIDEQQTSLGVTEKTGSYLNGVLIPIANITPELQAREKSYQFIPLDVMQIEALSASVSSFEQVNQLQQDSTRQAKVWLCRNLSRQNSNKSFPICQTYLDTCLIGCLEAGSLDFAEEFLRNTHFWQHGWVNDRAQPRYPRAAKMNKEQQVLIDKLLAEFELLAYRDEISE